MAFKRGREFQKKRGKPAIIEFSVRFILMLHYKFARKPRLERECGMSIVEFQACVYSIDCVHKSRAELTFFFVAADFVQSSS